MKKGQRMARRMALYLSSIGVPPAPSAGSYKQWAAVLQDQYNALEVGQRTLARQTGRRLLKESGSIAIAVASLAHPVALQPEVANSPPVAPRTRSRSREEQFDYIRRRWSALTPPCPPAGCETVSLNVPGPLASGPMRFGEDNTIATPCVSTSAPFSRASGIWVIFARQMPRCCPE
jgi:hypothetical protein